MGFSKEAAKYLAINAAVWLVVSWMDIIPFTKGSAIALVLAMSLWFGGPALLVIAWVNLGAASRWRVPFRPLLALGLAVTASPLLIAISNSPFYVQLAIQGCYVLTARRAWGD